MFEVAFKAVYCRKWNLFCIHQSCQNIWWIDCSIWVYMIVLQALILSCRLSLGPLPTTINMYVFFGLPLFIHSQYNLHLLVLLTLFCRHYAYFGWHLAVKKNGKIKHGRDTWHPFRKSCIHLRLYTLIFWWHI